MKHVLKTLIKSKLALMLTRRATLDLTYPVWRRKMGLRLPLQFFFVIATDNEDQKMKVTTFQGGNKKKITKMKFKNNYICRGKNIFKPLFYHLGKISHLVL